MHNEIEKKAELVQLLHDLKSKNTSISIMADASIDELIKECGKQTVDKWMEELDVLFKSQEPKTLAEALQLIRQNQKGKDRPHV